MVIARSGTLIPSSRSRAAACGSATGSSRCQKRPSGRAAERLARYGLFVTDEIPADSAEVIQRLIDYGMYIDPDCGRLLDLADPEALPTPTNSRPCSRNATRISAW
jgi:hypothetical protein